MPGNRPSVKAGSFVTLVAKASNYDWDRFVWILYDSSYTIVEAWRWARADYIARFATQKRISPKDMRL